MSKAIVRRCLCFRCRNILNPKTPSTIIFCPSCLRDREELAGLFPDASVSDLNWLLRKGSTSLSHTSKILGFPFGTLYGYYQRGYLEGEPITSRFVRVKLYALRKFREKQQNNLSLSQAAAELGLTKRRMKYLAQTGQIPFHHFLGMKAVYRDDLPRIGKTHQSLRYTVRKRRRKKITSSKSRLLVAEMAKELECSEEWITAKIREGRLRAERAFNKSGKDWHWEASLYQFTLLCQNIVTGNENTRSKITRAARTYLDSLAAG